MWSPLSARETSRPSLINSIDNTAQSSTVSSEKSNNETKPFKDLDLPNIVNHYKLGCITKIKNDAEKRILNSVDYRVSLETNDERFKPIGATNSCKSQANSLIDMSKAFDDTSSNRQDILLHEGFQEQTEKGNITKSNNILSNVNEALVDQFKDFFDKYENFHETNRIFNSDNISKSENLMFHYTNENDVPRNTEKLFMSKEVEYKHNVNDVFDGQNLENIETAIDTLIKDFDMNQTKLSINPELETKLEDVAKELATVNDIPKVLTPKLHRGMSHPSFRGFHNSPTNLNEYIDKENLQETCSWDRPSTQTRDPIHITKTSITEIIIDDKKYPISKEVSNESIMETVNDNYGETHVKENDDCLEDLIDEIISERSDFNKSVLTPPEMLLNSQKELELATQETKVNVPLFTIELNSRIPLETQNLVQNLSKTSPNSKKLISSHTQELLNTPKIPETPLINSQKILNNTPQELLDIQTIPETLLINTQLLLSNASQGLSVTQIIPEKSLNTQKLLAELWATQDITANHTYSKLQSTNNLIAERDTTIDLLPTKKKDKKQYAKCRFVKSDKEKINFTKGAGLYEKSVILPQIMERLTARKLVLEQQKHFKKRLILDNGTVNMNNIKNNIDTCGKDICDDLSKLTISTQNDVNMNTGGEIDVSLHNTKIHSNVFDITGNAKARLLNKSQIDGNKSFIERSINNRQKVEQISQANILHTIPKNTTIENVVTDIGHSQTRISTTALNKITKNTVDLNPIVLQEDCNRQRLLDLQRRQRFTKFVISGED